jgi:hypothetical protein
MGPDFDDFVDDYFSSKRRVVYENDYYEHYNHSSNNGKFGLSWSMIRDLMDSKDFDKDQLIFALRLVTLSTPDSNPRIAGVVKIERKYFDGYVSKNKFHGCKKRFIKDNYIIPIPNYPKYFILNTHYFHTYKKGVRPK